MSVEYDLVIIGNSPEAFTAATEALQFPARVALVVTDESDDIWLNRHLYQLSLIHNPSLLHNSSDFAAQLRLTQQNSLAMLAAEGIDVVIGRGEFVRLPSLAFVVKQRRLRSRTYLIATGTRPTIPPIEGLQELNYLTSIDLWQNKAAIPKKITIIGETIQAIELAQCLHNQGKKITIVTGKPQLLPFRELEASNLLQATLEAQGITIFNISPVSQIRKIDAQTWLQAGDQAIETDAILVTPLSTPNVEGLNLEGVGIKAHQSPISVNTHLQTDNPRIYACGELINEHSCLNLAQYQAKIAVHNALGLWKLTPNYQTIPQVVFTTPQLASVGLSETEAKKIYGQKVDILHAYADNIALAQIKDETSGLVKLIVKNNGQILGAHLVDVAGGEMIGTIATAMQAKISIAELAFKFPCLTRSEMFHKIALKWEINRPKNSLFTSLKATLLKWRRSWSS